MTRYSRRDAEQLIPDAIVVAHEMADVARALEELRRLGDTSGSEAALLHARLDRNLTWFHNRHIRLENVAPLTLAFGARMIVNGDANDVWLSWREGEDGIQFYYPQDDALSGRRLIPAAAWL